jgi:acyl-CoA synthetase (NDP forming)
VNGLQVPVLSERTQQALRALLPSTASVANPVDMIASATPEQYRRALEIVTADPTVDSVIAIFIPPLVTEPAAVASAIRTAAAKVSKPVLASFLGANGLSPHLAPVPSFAFPESAAVALAHVTRYGEWLRKPVPTVESCSPDIAGRARAIVDAALAAGKDWLAPVDCEALLATADIPVLHSRVVATADEAVAAARDLGLPIVLKAIGPHIIHKSDVGGVRLGLGSEHAVRDAFAALTAHLGDRAEAILVQPMVSGGIEMVVGGINDPSFGPVVMCGLGGVLVDVLDDTAFATCPLGDVGARTLIDRLKGRVCLRGFRGAAPADESAFRRLLISVSQLVHACPDILELDLNPVMALPSGAVAVDVRIRVGRRAPTSGGRRIRY